MGWNHYDIIYALKATQNDLQAACSWLLGDKEGVVLISKQLIFFFF